MAIILAVGLATAVNLITVGVLYDAIFSEGPGLSSNATQILTTVFGGIVGILGGYIGFRAAASMPGSNGTSAPTPVPPPTTEPSEPWTQPGPPPLSGGGGDSSPPV